MCESMNKKMNVNVSGRQYEHEYLWAGMWYRYQYGFINLGESKNKKRSLNLCLGDSMSMNICVNNSSIMSMGTSESEFE